MFEFFIGTALASEIQQNVDSVLGRSSEPSFEVVEEVDRVQSQIAQVTYGPQEVMVVPEFNLVSDIPVQAALGHETYSVYRDKASTYLSEEDSNECALFVNRLFQARFGKMMYGNAWDLQLHPDNQRFIELQWQLDKDDYIKEGLKLHHYGDRVDHYQRLYEVLDSERYPIGTLGFVYQYSAFRDYVGQQKNVMPQTHITFLAGKKRFAFENISDQPLTLEEVLVEKYGLIHDFERDFVWSRVPLGKILKPGEKYFYYDYLVEEQFKQVLSESLLEVFLRKHKNNRKTPLLRPVSYSRISSDLIHEVQIQKSIMKRLGRLTTIKGADFDTHFTSEKRKDWWKGILKRYFGIEKPERALLVSVPL